MDKRREYGAAVGSIGLGLVALAMPLMFPTVPTYITYPIFAVGVLLVLVGFWPRLRDALLFRTIVTHNKVTRERLGAFLMQGKVLLNRCSNEALPSPESDVTAWENAVKTYLMTTLELSYIARFDAVGNEPLNIVDMADKSRALMCAGVRVRIVNLNKFIEELLP